MHDIGSTPYTENSEHTHWVGTALEKTGRFLTRPVSLFLTNGLRLIRPIQPGVGEQAPTYAKEVGCRVLYGAKAIALLAANLVLSPIELLGSCLRFTATQFFRKDVVWLHPKEEGLPPSDKHHAKSQDSIKVATFNIGAMPSFAGVFNNCGEMNAERQQAIADLINKMDDDVICIQEAFEGFGPIAQAVKKNFPYILYDVGRNSQTHLGSGLAILSRYPIKKFSYQKHPCAGGIDVFARKGVLAATITLPGNRPFLLFNTHLNAGASSSEKFPDAAHDYRRDQLQSMQEMIKEYVAQHFDFFAADFSTQKPIVLGAGDLNIGPTEKSKDEALHKLDGEWPDQDRRKFTGKRSEFENIMHDLYYQTVTDRFLDPSWREVQHDQAKLKTKVKNVRNMSQDELAKLATSLNRDVPFIEDESGNKVPKLDVQQLDHVFSIRNDVFGGNKEKIAKLSAPVLKVQDIRKGRDLVSDHAPLHVTYKILDDATDTV